jgi:hypothetical protein
MSITKEEKKNKREKRKQEKENHVGLNLVAHPAHSCVTYYPKP